MDYDELFKRAEDLARRCERSGSVTHTGFLTPAERYQLETRGRFGDCTLLFHGGNADNERTVAFFLPDWMEASDFDPAQWIRALELTAHFGTPGHRDYMGALLGMGIGREWLGDIRVEGEKAVIFCLPSVAPHLMSIEKVGRCGVSVRELPLEEVPAPERKVREKSFSVQSPRLDAVVGGMFNLSRSEAARQIALGNVSINYEVSQKQDSVVKAGDVLSLRGCGKGRISGEGGTSRKGRLFLYADIYQ